MALSRNKKNLILAGLILLALLFPGYLYYRSRLQFQKAHDALKQLADSEGQDLSPEEQNEKLTDLHAQVSGLSFRDQTKLLDELMEERREHIRRFFTLSPEEQNAVLDEEIDTLEELKRILKKMRQAQLDAEEGGDEESGTGKNGRGGASGNGRRGLGAGAGRGFAGGLGGGDGFGNGPGEGGPGAQGGLGGNASSDGGGPDGMLGPGGLPGPGQQGPITDPQERLDTIKRLLDASHPQDRARLAVYTQMMLQRRQARNQPGGSVPSAR